MLKSKNIAKNSIDLYQFQKPNIVIVGNPSLKNKFANIDINFNVSLIFTEFKHYEQAINENSVAVLLDENYLPRHTKSAVFKILDSFNFLPIFFTSRKVRKPQFYRSLYEKGIQYIFSGNRDLKLLPELIVETLKPKKGSHGKSDGDKQIAHVVTAHLNLFQSFKKIKVKCIDGYIFLSGYTNTIEEKEMAEIEAQRVLGVKKVISTEVTIKVKRIVTDEELERKVNMFISGTLGERKKSLTVKVNNGAAKLIGVFARPQDIISVEQYIKKIDGVVSFEKSVTFDKKVSKNKIEMAKIVERRIRNIFSGVKHISVKVLGGFAEVNGAVKIKEDRKLIEKYLEQTLPVNKIINKLSVLES